MLRGLVHLEQSGYVGVVNALQDLNLFDETGTILDFGLLDGLDRYSNTLSLLDSRLVDCAKAARSNSPIEVVEVLNIVIKARLEPLLLRFEVDSWWRRLVLKPRDHEFSAQLVHSLILELVLGLSHPKVSIWTIVISSKARNGVQIFVDREGVSA